MFSEVLAHASVDCNAAAKGPEPRDIWQSAFLAFPGGFVVESAVRKVVVYVHPVDSCKSPVM